MIIVFYVSLAMGLLIIIAWPICNKKAFKRRRIYLQNRPQMDYASWFDQYFKEIPIDFEIAREIVGLLANNIRCHPTQLYPSDSFTQELKFTGPTVEYSDDEIDLFFEQDLPLFFESHGIFNTVEKMMSDMTIKHFKTLKDVLVFCTDCLDRYKTESLKQ